MTPRDRERSTDWPLAVLAVVTATLASRLVERLRCVEEAREKLQHDLDVVLADVRDLRAEQLLAAKEAPVARTARSSRRTDFNVDRLREK